MPTTQHGLRKPKAKQRSGTPTLPQHERKDRDEVCLLLLARLGCRQGLPSCGTSSFGSQVGVADRRQVPWRTRSSWCSHPRQRPAKDEVDLPRCAFDTTSWKPAVSSPACSINVHNSRRVGTYLRILFFTHGRVPEPPVVAARAATLRPRFYLDVPPNRCMSRCPAPRRCYIRMSRPLVSYVCRGVCRGCFALS